MIDDLRRLAWQPQSEQEVADEAAAKGAAPPARVSSSGW
jgi:hypothetical protein